ncbi:hypothetical protein AALP_AA5G057700 [Arabis alpina]|uniref:Uncharacterized protein n=1 Tax=Arabis alpina TaxID=50452 RepID=A0A087GV67_ARAAL|nr:hypothetical protein AALP_AA5G057700 [Arabis alpina]
MDLRLRYSISAAGMSLLRGPCSTKTILVASPLPPLHLRRFRSGKIYLNREGALQISSLDESKTFSPVKEVMISSATTTTQLPSKHLFYHRPPEMPEPPDPPDPASTPSLLSTNPPTSPRCTGGLLASTVMLVTRHEGCSGDALKPTSQFDNRWSSRSPQTVSTLPCSLPVLLPRLCSHTYSLNHHHCATLSPPALWPCAHGDKLQRAAQPCLLRAKPDLKPPHLLLWRCPLFHRTVHRRQSSSTVTTS